MSVNGHGIELPSSWLRQRRSRRGDFARLRSQVRFGGGYTAAETIWLDYVWPAAGGTTTVDYQVGASSSDSHMTSITNDSGRSVTVSGAVSLTAATLSPGSHGSGDEWSVAARIDGVAVAQGSTINSAAFELRCQNTWNAAPNVIKYYISAQAADNAGALSATSGDLNTTARPRTTATVVVDWSSLTVDTWYSVDVTSVVQEIVNRAGWASGNAIVILVDTHTDTTLSEWQDFYSYDGAAASAPKLSITYASSGPTTSPITAIGGGVAAGYAGAMARGALSERDTAGSAAYALVRAVAAARGQASGSSSEVAAVRGRAVLVAADSVGAVAYSRPSAAGRVSVRVSGSSAAVGGARALGRLGAVGAGSSADQANPRGKGTATARDAGTAAEYGYLTAVSNATAAFGRGLGYSWAFAGSRGLGAARAIDAAGAVDYARPTASGGLHAVVVAGGADRTGARGKAAAQARAAGQAQATADIDGRGALRAVDAGAAIEYGYLIAGALYDWSYLTLSVDASAPGIAVTDGQPTASASARRGGLAVSGRGPVLATAGHGPEPDISGRRG